MTTPSMSTPDPTQPLSPILVLCATGKTGRRVVQRLRSRGMPTRVGSRSAAPAFDWTDPSTWSPALDGVSAAYIAYHPDLAVPGAPEAVAGLADRARRCGVRRLVLLSGRGEVEAQRAEQAVQASGVPWTIVRCSWFNQNFSEGYLLADVRAGEIALPGGEAAEPFLDADDIAEVAVAALTDARHEGQVYELTGPRLLGFADVAAEISAATGRQVRYRATSIEDYATTLAAQGVPDDVTGFLTYLFGEVLDGRNAQVTDGVARALGRPARDFVDFARLTAAGGGWDAA
jgi:uncharacterized protein YbjT (DUF2867 family)